LPYLIDQFADLVVGAQDPRGLAERTLDVVMSLTNGRSGAVFCPSADGLALFASRSIDQRALDGSRLIWGSQRELLEKGETVYIPDTTIDTRLGKDANLPPSLVAVPAMGQNGIAAVLYVDSTDTHFCAAHDLDRLAKFGRILARAVQGPAQRGAMPAQDHNWESYLERTPVEDMQKEKLLLLLNRNEWNIARVSRLMGVTRRTIYLRLERYKIPREKVKKTLRRVKPPAAVVA
jgi:hypothetical protein